MDLAREGGAAPSTEAIAQRAGVSVASLFRYFDGLEDLRRQVIARFFDRYAGLFDIPDVGIGPHAARVERYVAARITLYETIAPLARLSRAQSLDRADIALSLGEMRRQHADATRAHFAPELGAFTRAGIDDRVAVITAMTSFESWDLLQSDLARSRMQIRRAWTSSIAALTT